MGKEAKKFLNYISGILYLIGIFFVCSGFYKIFWYKNDDVFREDNVNNYVGGDAYNYMINSQRATAYFVIAGVLIITATLILIYNKMDDVQATIENLDFEVEDDSKEEMQDDYVRNKNRELYGTDKEWIL